MGTTIARGSSRADWRNLFSPMMVFTLALLAFGRQADTQPLDYGLITKSVTIAKGDYFLPARSDENGEPVLTIKGDGITVDFNHVLMSGSPADADPDKRAGVAVIVEGANVTIKNANIRGYKVGILARNCKNLTIVDSDLSYNWKQHLLSTPDREDLSDWMSYHHNEKNEWLRYGAGVYLQKVDGFEIRNVKITGGQCGLMMRESNHGKVWNNAFNFLSGIGVGMYRSSDNVVMHNKLDWCVRGYSHGVYARGQDSSGILIYEQSNRNVFAYNSATHGGDGFFLWAGQETMDSGKGGCNDNILYGNDFSHSPANGIESTFSRNVFAYNKLHECDHGVWAGYSYDTVIVANEFKDNNNGVSIEHGQNNKIASNVFWGDRNPVHLWMNAKQDPSFAYGKGHDTVSHDYTIDGNVFVRPENGLWLKDTKNVVATRNTFYQPKRLLRLEGATDGLVVKDGRLLGIPEPSLDIEKQNRWEPADFAAPTYSSTWDPLHNVENPGVQFAPKPMPGGQDPFIKPGAIRGRKYMLVDEWGPYDWRSPKLWPRGEKTIQSGVGDRMLPAKSVDLEVLGPAGAWRVVGVSPNVVVTPQAGKTGDTVNLTYLAGKVTDVKLELEYVGEATVDFRGVPAPAGSPVKFGFRKMDFPIDWSVKFFKWSEDTDPRTHDEAFKKLIAGDPVKSLHLDKLDYAGFQFDPEVGKDHFATVAEGVIEAPAGDYTLEVTTDDGCRVWLDDVLIIKDAWKYQGPTLYTAEIKLTGKHRFHVEHFQIDGYAALKVNLRPKR